jgi:hypothetical protein
VGIWEKAKVSAGGLGDLRKYPRGFKEIPMRKNYLFSKPYIVLHRFA